MILGNTAAPPAVLSNTVSAAMQAEIAAAALAGRFPKGLPTGQKQPVRCRSGRRHVWVAADRYHLHPTESTRLEGLVHDWKQCTECGLVWVVSSVPYSGMPGVVWMPAAVWSQWTDTARMAARGCTCDD